jgi:hypothetical protein
MSGKANLYEQDFFRWTQTTAARIRAGKWQEIDAEHLAEEIESLGNRDRRELGSRFEVLLRHLLKWRYQPSKRSGSWQNTIDTQRTEIAELLAQSLSLRPTVPMVLARRYPGTRVKALRDTGLPAAMLPEGCPWTAEQLLDTDFWPEGRP